MTNDAASVCDAGMHMWFMYKNPGVRALIDKDKDQEKKREKPVGVTNACSVGVKKMSFWPYISVRSRRRASERPTVQGQLICRGS